jgi:hypothetical protein
VKTRSKKTIEALATVAVFVTVSLTITHAGVLNPAPVASTGQTETYAPGDDGDLRQGVEWPEPRFTDNDDGTVTDHLTGLVWLQNPSVFPAMGWNPALAACNNLAADGTTLLDDGSVAGDWRLPNNKEVRRLIDFSKVNPALPDGHPFNVPPNGVFWSSTTATNNTGRAWTIDDGTMINDPKGASNLVWPVRDGSAGAGPAPVPKTGQSISYGARDDGELQQGVEWPGPRFTDNSDGTVTDNLTGLIWLQDALRFSDLSFADALAACNALADDGTDLTDDSLAGDWRLPNIWELGSLNDFGERGPALPVGNPFNVGNAGTYWSSTTAAANSNRAWTIGTGIGRVTGVAKGQLNQVWPVRGANPIAVDIKPGSCPNPLNVKSRGMQPVAILGTADFDVTMIDPVTIRLEGVAPIRSAVVDVAAPIEPFTGKVDCDLDCTDEGPDGWPDLTLKFKTQDIVAALGEAADRECRVMLLDGNLREEFGSTPIAGEDVLLIIDNKGIVGDDDTENGRRLNRTIDQRHPDSSFGDESVIKGIGAGR